MTKEKAIEILKGQKEMETEWNIKENQPLIEALDFAITELQLAALETHLQKLDTKVTQYADGKWIITIVDSGKMFESYLSHKDYGVSDYMFGYCSNNLADYMELVESNLKSYKVIYMKEYFD